MKSGIALIASAMLFVLFALKYTGFCFSEGGYLSKRRIIEAALAFELRKGTRP